MSEYKKQYHDFQGHPSDREDLIDFPVSNIFANHYFEEGYSTVKPRQPKTRQDSNEENLKRKVDSLAIEVDALHRTVEFLIKREREWGNCPTKTQQPQIEKNLRNSVRAGITLEALERV